MKKYYEQARDQSIIAEVSDIRGMTGCGLHEAKVAAVLHPNNIEDACCCVEGGMSKEYATVRLTMLVTVRNDVSIELLATSIAADVDRTYDCVVERITD